ncbi:MAG: hypothetical protein GXP05_16335 [Alphaproteobacteria bacterium]|nr:hypothetical protein [Alphaproteobacteria bacterium]
MTRTILCAILFWALPNVGYSDGLLDKCESPSASFDLAVELFKTKDFSVFQLEQDYGSKVLVFLGLGLPNEIPTANWFITGRAKENADYCYLGVGMSVEPLKSPHETKFPEKYGMPSSGFPRCSKSTDPLGAIKVRSWAAKEIGDSFVLALSPGAKGSGSFVVLVSRVDKSWVLLKKQDSGETCYFDRGQYYKSQNFRWDR